MTWFERMNKAIDYIENNLDQEINMEEVAEITYYSISNFQRIFSIIADMPLSEYIRKRKLTQAAFELQNSSIKIVDLSLKYGYESPEAFARAFQVIHGTTPSSARNEGISLKAFPRISFLLTIKGVTPMDYKIETKEAFLVYGIEDVFTTENSEHLKALPQFWMDIYEDGRYKKLEDSTNIDPSIKSELCLINGICDYRDTEKNTFPYMLFAFQTDKSNTEGYSVVEVPATTWAIFRSEIHTKKETSGVIQNLIKRVYTEWLPTSSYEKINGFELELYYGKDEKNFCEVWIRVAPKK